MSNELRKTFQELGDAFILHSMPKDERERFLKEADEIERLDNEYSIRFFEIQGSDMSKAEKTAAYKLLLQKVEDIDFETDCLATYQLLFNELDDEDLM